MASANDAPSVGQDALQSIPASPLPLVSLEAYLSNFFYNVFINDEPDVFELTFTRNYTRDVEEIGNGQPFHFEAFHGFTVQNRNQFANRELISQSFVAVPADATGKAGTVGHVVEVSATQGGKEVIIKIIAVVNIIFNESSRGG
ncbi:hypothetical protein GQ53DRAFT_834695 [Thozetella sp. PMI_491]|nr:hypothetical protein GQ53DRAFT_834695 [Thozetella sp. PMI_491]